MHFLLLISVFVALSTAVPKCSLEITPGPDTYISFGNSSCVLKSKEIQSVEAWVYPITEGQSFPDGIVFNSGWYTVNGMEKAIVLSIKENDQLMGYVYSRSIGGSSVSESISASSQKFVTPNAWNHIMWLPLEGRFYVGNTTSVRGVIYGSSLSGINTFAPGSNVLVGQSFSGRITALRLWASMETPASVATFFNTRNSQCANGIGSAVIAFWDFTTCNQVNSFNGNSCGKLQTASAFKWVVHTVSQYELLNPSNDAGHSWVDMCSAPTSCSSTCDTVPEKSTQNTVSTHPISGQNSSAKKQCFFTYFKSHPQVFIIVVFSVLLLIVVGSFVICKIRDQKKVDEAAVEEAEGLKDSDNEIEIPVVTSDMKPVYIPLELH